MNSSAASSSSSFVPSLDRGDVRASALPRGDDDAAFVAALDENGLDDLCGGEGDEIEAAFLLARRPKSNLKPPITNLVATSCYCSAPNSRISHSFVRAWDHCDRQRKRSWYVSAKGHIVVFLFVGLYTRETPWMRLSEFGAAVLIRRLTHTLGLVGQYDEAESPCRGLGKQVFIILS